MGIVGHPPERAGSCADSHRHGCTARHRAYRPRLRQPEPPDSQKQDVGVMHAWEPDIHMTADCVAQELVANKEKCTAPWCWSVNLQRRRLRRPACWRTDSTSVPKRITSWTSTIQTITRRDTLRSVRSVAGKLNKRERSNPWHWRSWFKTCERKDPITWPLSSLMLVQTVVSRQSVRRIRGADRENLPCGTKTTHSRRCGVGFPCVRTPRRFARTCWMACGERRMDSHAYAYRLSTCRR